MSRSADRILTTHTGSLPRPDDLIRIMWAKGDGIPVDEQALATRVASAVQEMVDKQVERRRRASSTTARCRSRAMPPT
jgi:5-methyltetrahydropteroyltriglutamate--homocysteine methyltransferase